MRKRKHLASRFLQQGKDSVLSMIRVACYAHQISEAVEMLEHCHEQGYETCLNIMAISIVKDAEIDQVLEIAAKSPALAVVVVDSFGNLYREQIDLPILKSVLYDFEDLLLDCLLYTSDAADE